MSERRSSVAAYWEAMTPGEQLARVAYLDARDDAELARLEAEDAAVLEPVTEYEAEDDPYQGETTSRYEDDEGKTP